MNKNVKLAAKQNPEAFDEIFEPVDEFEEKMFTDEEN